MAIFKIKVASSGISIGNQECCVSACRLDGSGHLSSWKWHVMTLDQGIMSFVISRQSIHLSCYPEITSCYSAIMRWLFRDLKITLKEIVVANSTRCFCYWRLRCCMHHLLLYTFVTLTLTAQIEPQHYFLPEPHRKLTVYFLYAQLRVYVLNYFAKVMIKWFLCLFNLPWRSYYLTKGKKKNAFDLWKKSESPPQT